MRFKLYASLTMLCVLMLFVCWPAHADEETQRIKVIDSSSKSVVSVRTYSKSKSKPGIGSGVIISSDGFLVTNAHVIKNAETIKVQLHNKKVYVANVYQTAKGDDLAILRINADGLPPAKLGDPDKVRVGQSVITIGDPLGFTGTVTVGMVSSLHRNVETKGIKYRDLIQTDAAINPGSSGGGMFNMKGELIGINALVYNGPANGYDKAQGLAFAIPIQTVRKVAKDILGSSPAPASAPAKKEKQAKNSAKKTPTKQSSNASSNGAHGWLGISGETITPQMAADYNIKIKTGVLVKKAAEGSPAKRAKLRSGDAISAINGNTVTSTGALQHYLSKCRPGDTILLNVWRGEKMFTIKITLD